MRCTIIILLTFVFLFYAGCSTPSNVTTIDKAKEELRDVLILTILAHDYLKDTDGKDFTMENLYVLDSLGRISNNFESIKQISRGGHIAIQYKFSESRNKRIEFTEREKKIERKWKVYEKTDLNGYDGEIQFEYGERFYIFRKIIVRKP